VEELEPKRQLFAALDRLCRPEAIFATNTSALSVSAIAAASGRPERVVGLHFFNPAPLMKLIEVVRTDVVNDDAYAQALAFASGLGKEAVPCPDTPGFLVNRLLIPILNDAVIAMEETGASPEDIDRAMKFGAGWPMGPFALADLVGLDVHAHAAEALWSGLREPRMAPPARLQRMVAAGHLGRKSGRGFFRYGG
jgi:3-hydroxybutyryl-CoA dehydrogenase